MHFYSVPQVLFLKHIENTVCNLKVEKLFAWVLLLLLGLFVFFIELQDCSNPLIFFLEKEVIVFLTTTCHIDFF